MPTDEYQPLLDRARAVVEAQELIGIAAPVLREVVNHASWAFQRCQAAPIHRGGENEDLAPLILYRHLIELADGVEVLLSSSCVDAAVPLVRSTFEASISLRYILAADYAQRSLAWTHSYLRSRIRIHERLDRNTPAGAAAGIVFDRDLDLRVGPPTAYDSGPPVARLMALLARPSFAPIEAEFQRTKATKRKNYPDWYELFNGPNNRRELARAVGEEPQYIGFYGEWSSFSHAADASAYLVEGDQPGQAAFLGVRTATRMPIRAFLTVGYLINATRIMLEHFRGGEDLRRWYFEDVKPLWDRLRTLRVIAQ